MPAKYSHVKKRSVSGLMKKSSSDGQFYTVKNDHNRNPNPHLDRTISQTMSAVSQLERTIARILLIRYEQDIARLFSTRLYNVSLVHLPTVVMRCISLGGPSWIAFNADCEEVKDMFRAAISMDMREAGERVATKSVLWSYTALRHFALSNNVHVCPTKGLQSIRLLPYFPALQAHLDSLESAPPPMFTKPPHLGPLTDGVEALEEACELKFAADQAMNRCDWPDDWRLKVRVGYEKAVQTLWRVVREFDVRGYGLALRDKLTTKWCECGCSTDHLGEVCEKTVREEEEESGIRSGKQREWDGRGSGIFAWETEEEEDIWELELDFGAHGPDECSQRDNEEMTIGELIEWRFFQAEREKEKGNIAFRKGDYATAAKHYKKADQIEPELPHYQLNLAAAHLKLYNWMEAEKACTKALSQHRSRKGYYRRAKARRMLGKFDEAVEDLRALLKQQPDNEEALAELTSLLPPSPGSGQHFLEVPSHSSPSSSSKRLPPLNQEANEKGRLGIRRPKPPKPLPFPRTSADDKKLKIMPMAHTVDMPVVMPEDPAPHRRMKHKKFITTRSEFTLKSETISYPGWERYIVQLC